jgi:PAS domain S-box-containing protein
VYSDRHPSEDVFYRIFLRSPDSITISSLEEGIYLEVNDSFERLTGFRREDVLGKPVSSLNIWADPSNREKLIATLKEHGAVTDVPFEFQTKDKGLLYCFVSAEIITFRGRLCLLAIVRDMTAAKTIGKSQEALYRIAELATAGSSLPELCQSIHEVVRHLMYADNFYVALYDRLSDTITFPYAVDEIDQFPDKPVACRKGLTEYVLRTARPLLATKEVERRLLESGEIEEVGAPAIDWLGVPVIHKGHTFGVIAVQNYRAQGPRYTEADAAVLTYVSHQISATIRRIQAEDRLRQAEKLEAVGQLASGIAHDFNNLLSVIIGHSSLLTQSHDSAVMSSANVITEAAQNGAALVRHLLSFSRVSKKAPELLNLKDALEESAVLLKRVLPENIHFAMGGSDALIRVDRIQLQHAVMNLVLNSRDALMVEGTLVVSWRTGATIRDSQVFHELSVKDSGAGMSAEVRAHMFEPFYTTKGAGKGTGLGLSMVYSFVKEHGGWIEVQSEEGVGTTIRLYLPAATNGLKGQPTVEPVLAPVERRETILVVEDQDHLRELTARILGGAGFQVLQANDGEAACSLAEHYPGHIDVLLADVVLPKMSGRLVAETISKARPTLKVVFMSGYLADETLHEQLRNENLRYIEKPFTPAQLLNRLVEILDEDTGAAA